MSTSHIEQFRAAIEAAGIQAPDEASHAAKPLAQNEPKAAPTLDDFIVWLNTSQQNELDAMNASRGDTFGQHCDHFIALTAAINALSEFQQVAAASATTTPTTSEAQAFAIERRTACTLCPTADKPCLKNEVAA